MPVRLASTPLFCVILAGVFHGLLASEPEGYPIVIPITQFISPSGVVMDGERARLVRKVAADAQNIVAIEAEEADKLLLQPRAIGRIGEDPNASNGRFIHFADRADYSFETKTAGNYQAWHRVWFPFKASWNHAETLDGRPETVIDSANNQPAEQWLWLKGPRYNLKAGTHSFTLNGYHGGARLDKVVFALEPESDAERQGAFQPKDRGPVSHHADAPSEGRVETPAFVPEGLRRWDQLEWNAAGGGGNVAVFFSRDLGKTWNAVPADGSLASARVTPDGYNGIKFAFEFKTSQDGVTPILQTPQLHYLGPPPTVLSNDKLALEFSAGGELLKIVNRKTGAVCSTPGMRSAPLEIVALNSTGLQPLALTGTADQKMTTAADGFELQQRYLFENGKVEAEMVIQLGRDELSSWKVKITNHSEQPIVHVDFPRLNGVRIGDSGEDDWFFISKVNGNLYPNPSQSRTLFADTAAYPRALAYKFVSLWDASGGLYVASLDPTFRDTGITVNKSDETSLKIDFRKWVRIQPGDSWQSSEYVLATHAGDWHWAADHYRQWLEPQNIPDHTPRWMREEYDGWDNRAGMLYPAYGFHGLVRTMETSAPLGLSTVMSNRQGFDTNVGWCGLAPAANPTWGTEAEFAQANLAVQERGGHSFFYINWHLWHRAYSSGKRIGRNPRALWPTEAPFAPLAWFDRNAVRHPNGVTDKETPFAVYEEHPLCNAATDTIRFHADWSRYYVEKYRATGIYWDTLNDGYAPCYAFDHGHADLGQWEQGSRRGLEESNTAARKSDPHYASGAEGICSAYLHGATDLLIADGNFISYDVARYTTPRSILVGGAWDAVSPPYAQTLEDMNCQFLTAVRFMGLTWDEETAKMMKLRRAVKQLLYPARYRDIVGLKLERPAGAEPQMRKNLFATGEFTGAGAFFPPANGILATHLRLDRSGTAASLVNLLNTTGKDGATVELSKKECPNVKLAWLARQDGSFQPISVTDTGAGWKFPVPAETRSIALLIEQCEPLVEVEAPAYVASGEIAPITVRVRNLNTQPFTGAVRIQGPDGFQAKPARFESIGSGEMKTATLQLKAPSNHTPRRYDLDAVASAPKPPSSGPGGFFARLFGVKAGQPSPPDMARRLFWIYVGPPVRITIRESVKAPRGVDLLLENMSSRTIRGSCETLANEFAEGAKAGFDLAPHQGRTVTLALTIKKPFDLPLPVAVKIRHEKFEREMIQSLTPNVINGGFETDLAGDGQPDGWSFYGPAGLHGMLRYDQIALDDQVKHTGRCSLRLPAAPQGGANIGIAMRTHALAGRSYRVRAAIRREVDGPAYVVAGGVALGEKGAAGKWEVFEAVVSPPPMKIPGPGAPGEGLGDLNLLVGNRTPGNAWFDSITVEEMAVK